MLVPGGRIAVAVWAGPEHNPWMTHFGMAMMMNGLVGGGPPTGPGGIFSLADPAVLEAVVREGGFDDVAVRDVPDDLALRLERRARRQLRRARRAPLASARLSPRRGSRRGAQDGVGP